MRGVLCGLYIFGIIDFAHTQYLALGTSRKPKALNLCDTSKSALVEHFFAIIFNEFHNTPPICVCVQMCPDQATYCYPNGCLKKSANRKAVRDSPIIKDSEDTRPLMLFVDDKRDFMGDLLENRVDESKLLKTEKTFIKKLRPDPFKDKYKMLFKFRKTPRVELKYHYGEQAKNMKSDKMKQETTDVSNTRWPSNKNRRSNKRIYIDQQKSNGINNNAKLQVPSFKDNKIPSYPSKYFKRDLRNISEDNDEPNDALNVRAIYVVGKTNVENSSFSLETLIDDIIENSFDYESTTADTDDNFKINQTGNTDPIEIVVKENVTIPNNESMNIISINFTNETVDKNMYLGNDVIENNTESYSNMIATLAKKIDLQNNTSLKMMKMVVGTVDEDVTVITDSYIDDTTQSITTEIPPSLDYEVKVTKKNKQRFARKLLNRKIN